MSIKSDCEQIFNTCRQGMINRLGYDDTYVLYLDTLAPRSNRFGTYCFSTKTDESAAMYDEVIMDGTLDEYIQAMKEVVKDTGWRFHE